MAWVRLDDQAPRNHKMLKAGPAACWLWVCGIAHCQSQLTDGFIAREALPMMGIHGAARCHQLAATLVAVGLFEKVKSGYQVHDYLAFNSTREEATKNRIDLHEKRSKAGKLGGWRSATAKQLAIRRAQANSSPDPTRPDQEEPPTPFAAQKGRRLTRAERKHAAKMGPPAEAFDWVCPHDEHCGNRTTCAVVSARAV